MLENSPSSVFHVSVRFTECLRFLLTKDSKRVTFTTNLGFRYNFCFHPFFHQLIQRAKRFKNQILLNLECIGILNIEHIRNRLFLIARISAKELIFTYTNINHSLVSSTFGASAKLFERAAAIARRKIRK